MAKRTKAQKERIAADVLRMSANDYSWASVAKKDVGLAVLKRAALAYARAKGYRKGKETR